MIKELSSKVRVRFQDCDPYNHLNNSKYIDYFINAREDQLIQHYNLNVFKHTKETGNSWVVQSNQVAYLKPVKVMEEVVIKSSLISYTDKVLKVEMRMYDKHASELKSAFWIQFFYVDARTGKPSQHGDDMMTLFESVEIPAKDQIFEKWVYNLRKEHQN